MKDKWEKVRAILDAHAPKPINPNRLLRFQRGKWHIQLRHGGRCFSRVLPAQDEIEARALRDAILHDLATLDDPQASKDKRQPARRKRQAPHVDADDTERPCYVYGELYSTVRAAAEEYGVRPSMALRFCHEKKFGWSFEPTNGKEEA